MKTIQRLYHHPVKFICSGCHRSFTTLLGYSEHIEGANLSGSHYGRQCEFAVYPYLCAVADCQRNGRMCGLMKAAQDKIKEG